MTDPGVVAPEGGGTYTLLVDLDIDRATTVRFGGAGERALVAGRYAYTGSALGPGGFARIDRHRRVAAGDHEVRHWHVDYLLGHPEARLAGDVRSSGVAAECSIAGEVASTAGVEPIDGIGASDCACGSHLAFARLRSSLDRAVRRAHERSRG